MSKHNFFFLKQTYLYSPSLSCFHVTQQKAKNEQKKKLTNKQKSYHTNHPKSSHVWTFFFSCRLDAVSYQSIFLPSQKKSTNMIFRYFAVWLHFEGHVTFELSKVVWYRIAMTLLVVLTKGKKSWNNVYDDKKKTKNEKT